MSGPAAIKSGIVTSPPTRIAKPVEATKPVQASPSLGKDLARFGSQALDLGSQALTAMAKHPLKIVGVASAIVAGGELIAHRDQAEALAVGAAQVIGDNPVKTSAAVGLATYVASKDGVDPAAAVRWAKANPFKAAILATITSWSGIRFAKAVVARAEEPLRLERKAAMRAILKLTGDTSSVWVADDANLAKGRLAILRISQLAKPMADSGDALAQQIENVATVAVGTDNVVALENANDVTLKSIRSLVSGSGS